MESWKSPRLRPAVPRAHSLALAASIRAPGNIVPSAGLDPLLQEKLGNLSDSLSTLLLSERCFLPSEPPGQQVAEARQARGGECLRCAVLTRQQEALVQALVGLAARTFNWSAGMSKVRRRDLAELILEYASPCAALHEDLVELCTELQGIQWSELSAPGRVRTPPPEPLDVLASLQPPSVAPENTRLAWGRSQPSADTEPSAVDVNVNTDARLAPAMRRGSSMWKWWDLDMAAYNIEVGELSDGLREGYMCSRSCRGASPTLASAPPATPTLSPVPDLARVPASAPAVAPHSERLAPARKRRERNHRARAATALRGKAQPQSQPQPQPQPQPQAPTFLFKGASKGILPSESEATESSHTSHGDTGSSSDSSEPENKKTEPKNAR